MIVLQLIAFPKPKQKKIEVNKWREDIDEALAKEEINKLIKSWGMCENLYKFAVAVLDDKEIWEKYLTKDFGSTFDEVLGLIQKEYLIYGFEDDNYDKFSLEAVAEAMFYA